MTEDNGLRSTEGISDGALGFAAEEQPSTINMTQMTLRVPNLVRPLVESWKSDMDALLIFAGLFSASLTTFIIEIQNALTGFRRRYGPSPGSDIRAAIRNGERKLHRYPYSPTICPADILPPMQRSGSSV
ncbi:hypothetical protein R3P38DRAFT_3184553 [Favolaschia claudopus]|uniref:DUF6535 domain-containing protein n=1 Tax=Favolaschia claudopus TaxID=2862362 RepID=A0AAW0C6E0_9AGAR